MKFFFFFLTPSTILFCRSSEQSLWFHNCSTSVPCASGQSERSWERDHQGCEVLKVGEVYTILNVVVTNVKRKLPELVSGFLGSKFAILSFVSFNIFYSKWTNSWMSELLLETILQHFRSFGVSIWLPLWIFFFYMCFGSTPTKHTLPLQSRPPWLHHRLVTHSESAALSVPAGSFGCLTQAHSHSDCCVKARPSS